MKTKLPAIIGIVLFVTEPAGAHRLNEYLQATLISLEHDRVLASMRLIPGVAVSAAVLANIDINRDGVISQAEGQAYARQVLADVSLSLDGHALTAHLTSVHFPAVEQMKEGLGEIQIEFIANLPHGAGQRKLVLENHHQTPISAYLVNCLATAGNDIRVVAQNRNETQSLYELDFAQDADAISPAPTGIRALLSSTASMFRLGMKHIAEGTDHLLFLLALLLPAPLLVRGYRWAEFGGTKHSVKQILKVVTAFTVGHSVTLLLAGLGVLLSPSRPIEVLIAVSILVSSIHAVRPLFPGREAVIAGFFGLIHGMAFAATLGQLGLERWVRVANIFAFNLAGC